MADKLRVLERPVQCTQAMFLPMEFAIAMPDLLVLSRPHYSAIFDLVNIVVRMIDMTRLIV